MFVGGKRYTGRIVAASGEDKEVSWPAPVGAEGGSPAACGTLAPSVVCLMHAIDAASGNDQGHTPLVEDGGGAPRLGGGAKEDRKGFRRWIAFSSRPPMSVGEILGKMLLVVSAVSLTIAIGSLVVS